MRKRQGPAKRQQKLQNADQTSHDSKYFNPRRPESKIEGVVLRQLQSALKGNERSAMAAIKMAMLVGLLEDNTPAEASALGAADEQILEQLLTRHRRARRR
jgi:hypothetical protein